MVLRLEVLLSWRVIRVTGRGVLLNAAVASAKARAEGESVGAMRSKLRVWPRGLENRVVWVVGREGTGVVLCRLIDGPPEYDVLVCEIHSVRNGSLLRDLDTASSSTHLWCKCIFGS